MLSDSHTNTVISDRFAYPSRWRGKVYNTIIRLTHKTDRQATHKVTTKKFTYTIFFLLREMYLFNEQTVASEKQFVLIRSYIGLEISSRTRSLFFKS